jgi:hypothetical protein
LLGDHNISFRTQTHVPKNDEVQITDKYIKNVNRLVYLFEASKKGTRKTPKKKRGEDSE